MKRSTSTFKIGYLLPQLDPGGSEAHVIRLSEGLRKRGHEAEILCVFEEGRLGALARQKGIPLEALNLRYGWGFQTLAGILKTLRVRKFDILHTYLFGFHFFGGMPARLARVPVVISSRRDVELSQKNKILWLEKLGNGFADKVVCCSKAVERWVLEREQIAPERLVTLYNGVDTKEFAGPISGKKIREEFHIPGEDPVIGTISNFSFKKGYPYLFEAAERVFSDFPNAWFLWVGFGPLEEEMKRKASESSYGSRMIFAGLRRDIPELIAAMDLFVFASLWEGLPNVVLEAMAMAKPVVSTAVGGVPEVIHSGQEGLLIPPKDSVSLAHSIVELLRHPDKAKRMGEQALKKIHEEFTLERMIDDYEKFYLEMLRDKGCLSQESMPEKKVEAMAVS